HGCSPASAFWQAGCDLAAGRSPISLASVGLLPGMKKNAIPGAASAGACHFFLGTLAPFLRASESPMAIACLRLFTLPPLPPLPDLSVPRLRRRIALSTVLPAALPYFRPPDLRPPFLLGI